MARSMLVAGAAAWTLAGLAAVAIATFGAEALERSLPPLAIDTDALRGAVTALGAGVLTVGFAHVLVLIGLRSGRRWAWSSGILLAAGLAATLLALATAAVTGAAATPAMAPPLIGSALGAGLAAAGYALAVRALLRDRGPGSPD